MKCLRRSVFAVASVAMSMAMGGCSGGYVAAGDITAVIEGTVQAGTVAVSGATIQLYTAGASGYGSAATPMLASAATTGSDGTFTLSGDYKCGVSGTGTSIAGDNNEVYLVATGGNPGLTGNVNNKALVLVAALGPCSSLSGVTKVTIDEVTTVAAAWTLAPFMTSATNVGAPATNAMGIQNAFANAALLANRTTGLAATPASNLTVETGKLYALANTLAGCADSDGGLACTSLFVAATLPGGTAPTDTLGAALNVVKHPGTNVKAIYQAASTHPFASTLSQSPNDWTMSMTVSGGGLSLPTDLAIDQENNVWVAGEYSPVSAFGPQGSPLSASGFGQGQVFLAFGIAVDTLGDVWVTNYNTTYRTAGAVTKFYGSDSGKIGQVATGTAGNPGFYDNSLQYPTAIAADTNGNIFIANNGTGAATVYDSNGNYVSNPGGLVYALPQALAVDSSHGVWLSNFDQTVTHYSAAGALLSYSNCCMQSYGVATDASGNLWVADYLGGTSNTGAYAEVAANGTVVLSGQTGGGIAYPAMVAVDGAQNVWMSNLRGNSITEIAGAGSGAAAGTAISPSSGVYGTGGYGLDAGLSEPFGIGPDRSGDVWVSNQNKNALTMFFGLAAPTATPVQPVPVVP